MRELIRIIEAAMHEAKTKAEPQPVAWPTNLAWRIRFKKFSGLEYFRDFRRNKAFAMPFRNWERTFYKLTLKDTPKLKFMPTEVIEVSDDAMVGEMDLIDYALRFIKKNDPVGALRRQAEPYIAKYEREMVPYSEFKRSPDMFIKPEIMVERATMRVLPYRVVPVWDSMAEEYRLALTPSTVQPHA